jgi:large subunit ribosomal protein L24
MPRHIKTGDQVMVIAGADKGQTGRVLRVLTSRDRVVVEGINRQGGRIQKDAPIHLSNVMPIDPTTGKGVRTRHEIRNGKKHRVAVGSNTDLGIVGNK